MPRILLHLPAIRARPPLRLHDRTAISTSPSLDPGSCRLGPYARNLLRDLGWPLGAARIAGEEVDRIVEGADGTCPAS